MTPRMIWFLSLFMIGSSVKNIYEIIKRDDLTTFECFVNVFIVTITIYFIFNYGSSYQFLG